ALSLEAETLLRFLAAVEAEHLGNAGAAVADGDFLAIVDVQFAHLHLVVEMGRQVVNDRRQRPTGPPPGLPEIDDDGDGTVDDLLLPVVRRQGYYFFAGHDVLTSQYSGRTRSA